MKHVPSFTSIDPNWKCTGQLRNFLSKPERVGAQYPPKISGSIVKFTSATASTSSNARISVGPPSQISVCTWYWNRNTRRMVATEKDLPAKTLKMAPSGNIARVQRDGL